MFEGDTSAANAPACMAPGDGSGEGGLQDQRPAHSLALLVLAPPLVCGQASVSCCVEAGGSSSEKRRTSLALAAKLDPVPQDATFFGDKIFKEVVKLK